MKKNDEFEIDVIDIGNDGEGIGKYEGMTFFIKGALPGDRIRAGATLLKKSYGYARLISVVRPSPYRVPLVCPIAEKCGGCQIQGLSYEKQLELKERKITENLVRIGGFSPEFVREHMDPIVGMETPFHYRNKAQYPIGTDKNGNPIAGFYAGRTHSIIQNTRCYLGTEENEAILDTILSYMKEYGVSAYNEASGKGLIRHVLIRKGFYTGELMVCLVINLGDTGKKREKTDKVYYIPHQRELIDKLTKIHGMTSISVDINSENTNVIMGSEVHTIWGEDTISDVIHVRDMQKEGFPLTGDSLAFSISPLSFYQVNPIQTEKLYSLALEYAGLTGKESVWDLYCGIGTISLFMARKAKQVYGVEIVGQAIEDAGENAGRNGITNVKFFVGKAEEVLPEFYNGHSVERPDCIELATDTELEELPAAREVSNKVSGEDSKLLLGQLKEGSELCKGQPREGSEIGRGRLGENSEINAEQPREKMLHPDVIVVDPPRKGCDEACLSTMLKMQPDRIVYVSCDSATLARDLKILCEGGYEIQKIRGVDQFGHTVHIETVVLLSKLKQDAHIEI